MEDEQIVIALVVVLIGYSTQYWYSKKLESEKHKQNLRTNAYVDFIMAVTGKAITQKNKMNKEQEFDLILAEAKARLSIYGSKEVIESIAKFWREGDASLGTPEGRDLFINIWQTMRKEYLPKDENVLNKEISQLLFEED